MNTTPPALQTDDAALERAIGRVLRIGIGATTACLAVGLVLALAGAGTWAATLLAIGLILLMATPAARVIVSIVDYARERDWLFVVLTIVVLLQLLASVIAAFVK